MIWHLQHIDRSIVEREALEALVQRAPWLTIVGWRIDDQIRLIVDADIQVGTRIYRALLRYPSHFPYGPPLVIPRDGQARWSGHQYGSGGELCLEWRPDTWHPDATGAQVLESAFDLLQGESPTGPNTGTVASAHKLTVGQDLRFGNYSRILLTAASREKLQSFGIGKLASGTLVGVFHKEAAGLAIEKLEFEGSASWIDAGVPNELADEGARRTICIVRLPDESAEPPVTAYKDFVEYFGGFGLTLPDVRYILVVRKGLVSAYFTWPEGDSACNVAVIEPEPERQRLGSSHLDLRQKKVAVIGCGSLGSKVATTLARCGVGNFLLVDDDILYPGNLVRNDLDWRDVGTHKADALARRLRMVNAAVDVVARKHRLGGQESGSSFESMITSIAKCDLIVDAAADPNVFNLLTAAAAHGNKTLLWCEVFGGGIGGLVARSRPGKDPDPASARIIIEQWSNGQGKEAPKPVAGYGLIDDETLIADDADVTVIAGHAARLAIDTLVQREPSLFPVSAYVIGLAKAWAFSAPYETFPIDLGPAIERPDQEISNPAKVAAELKRLLSLIGVNTDETDRPTSNSPAA